MTYQEFLESKIELATDSGFVIEPEKVNKILKPHQRDAVMWALKGGRRALFESFGLGKTVQELEFCHLAAEHEKGRALIVLPLGVKQEFTRDAVEILGYERPIYCRTMDEVKACDSQIVLTNYERVRDGDIDPSYFVATSLDEASVLRSFGSKTYQTFLDKFKNVPYKLVATATPSPNKYKELIHYAGYLEVMDTGQALTRFFQRDSTKANHLTLYPNMEDEFWLWISSWALFITKPSDLNPEYSDEGYDLPPLEVRWHEIPIHYGDAMEKDGELIVDNFAGGGGASTGIELATGYSVDIAINHDPEAIKMHKANHPYTRHYCENVWAVDPVKACKGHPVALAWFSPDCKHFSKAKGGKPKDKNIRGLAWVACRWAGLVRPRVIMLENVEEFKTWGPLNRSHRPIKAKQGVTFKKFVSQLQDLGYQVEFRELVAADYGAPTMRKRFL